MARLNIYVPDELTPLIEASRGQINFSEVCVAALRDAFRAQGTLRSPQWLLSSLFMGGSILDQELAHRYGLRHAVAEKRAADDEDPRETVARMASMLLDRTVFDGVQLAVGGGIQMWNVIRRLSPRPVRLAISAIGVEQVDPRLPHAHPNLLATLLWLLYSPRSTATLVGAPEFEPAWASAGDDTNELRRVIIGSCAPFDKASAYAKLLGEDATTLLHEAQAAGDFMGVFLTPDGQAFVPPSRTSASRFGGADLYSHAKHGDTLVVLAAAGSEKTEIIRLVLKARLCNVLITDEPTARALMKHSA